MNAPTLDEVEARLRALPATLTPSSKDARAIARLEMFSVQQQHRRRNPARLVAVAVAAVAVLVIADGVAAYYAPRYGQALAQVPLVGGISAKLLEFYGVTGQNVTMINNSSTSSWDRKSFFAVRLKPSHAIVRPRTLQLWWSAAVLLPSLLFASGVRPTFSALLPLKRQLRDQARQHLSSGVVNKIRR